jgi:hypothetical protein
MVIRYKQKADRCRSDGFRAPRFDPTQFKEEEVIFALQNAHNYAEACIMLGLSTRDKRVPSHAVKKLEALARFFKLDLGEYLTRGGRPGYNPKMNRKQFIEKILVKGDTYRNGHIKKMLYHYGIKNPVCEECGIGLIWQEKPLVLELHHVNGDNTDNRLENLQILCPNCHSQTDNHRAKSRKSDD